MNVHNTGDKISEDGLHEQNLRQELGPNQFRSLEVQMIGNLETNGEGHLIRTQLVRKCIPGLP